MSAIDLLSQSMMIDHEYGHLTWREIGDKYGISGGLAYRIVEESYEPQTPEIRRRLGLPVIIPTPACPDCGAVHTIPGVCVAKSKVTVTVYQVTPEELAKIDKPVTVIVRQSPGVRRNRASINLEDAGSAARTIRKKMDPQMLALLLELLKESE